LEESFGHAEESSRLVRRAHQLVPSLAGAALAVAEELELADDSRQALAIYDRLLGNPEALGSDERLRARYGRGRLGANDNRLDAAIEDLRDGLRLSALHPGLLQALADVLYRKGRFAAAVQHYTTALLLAHEPTMRATLYSRIGRLWEEQLENPEEAGACYDLAIAAGSDDTDVMARALGHYRRTAQGERALAVIERLLPITTEPRTLAMLWSERGRIYSPSDSDKAIEAFDLALSYDPSCQPAVSGLAALLEQRGDWKQLVDLLEVRAETGTLESRGEALRALARISRNHLKDPKRTRRLLLDVTRLDPRKEDYTELLSLYGDDPRLAGDRRDATAGLLRISGPWMAPLIEMGRVLAAEGHRRWAWTVLSPLMSTTMPDAQTKTLVLELRKEFDKGDNVDGLRPEDLDGARHPDLTPALWQVLVELERVWAVAPATVEGAAKLDQRTAVGKSFALIADRLGMGDAILHRAPELAASGCVLGGEHTQIVLRGDLLPLLSPSELSFWLASLLASARPGSRLLLSLPPDEAKQLLAALFSAVGLSETPANAALVEQLKTKAAGLLAGWREHLAGAALPPERILASLHESALRVGLLAVPDLRTALKLLGRIDDSAAKLPSTGKLEDVDEVFASSPPARGLAAFALSSGFGERIS
jgi:tetratricopeptide (TPR) repeat protein